MATPSLAADRETVRRRCAEARESMELTSQLLLLQQGARPQALEPAGGGGGGGGGNESFGKARDVIVANTKGLAISIKDLVGLLGQDDASNHAAVCQAVLSIGEQVVVLTEAAANAAYLSALASDPGSKPASPGVTDGYAFAKARQTIYFAYERFKLDNGPMSVETILQISRTFADNLAVLTKGCKTVIESAGLNDMDKAQFSTCVQSLQGTTAAFLTSLKSFASSTSIDDRKRCLIFGRPVLEAVNSVVTFAGLPQFAGRPAQLSRRGSELQTEILGGAMAVVSSSVQLLNSTEAIMEGKGSAGAHGWQRIVSCSKAVAEATKLLCTSLKEHDPVTPRARSPNPSGTRFYS